MKDWSASGYSSGVDEPDHDGPMMPVRAEPAPSAHDSAAGAPPDVALSPQPPRQRPVVRWVMARIPLLFAITGVVVAVAAGGLYLLGSPAEEPLRLSPEETVQEFLAAVFLTADPNRVGQVVCGNWDPVDAVTRTTNQVEKGSRVSWDQVQVVSRSAVRVTVRARFGIRRQDDHRPSGFQAWRFSLVDEDGWRVCEARPLTV